MRKQKRNPSQRAFSKGYQVGFQGHSDELCPHPDTSQQAQGWKNGWEEGRNDYLMGYSVATSQQRLGSLSN